MIQQGLTQNKVVATQQQQQQQQQQKQSHILCAKKTQAASAYVLAILLKGPDVSRPMLQSKPMLQFEADAAI
jgi:hypothetical protein